jgi:HicB family
MRRSNFALRLQPSLMEEARKVAEAEGVALNQLINVALAEKVSALRTEEYFQERARRADRAETLRILERAGKGNPPLEGDELPPDWKSGGKIKQRRAKATPRARLSRKRAKK